MKELYLDLTTGAAGDMISAALLELFDDRGAALARLNAIGVPGVEYAALPVTRSGVTGTRLEVRYHGEEEGSEPAHHASRGLADVTEIVSKLNLPEEVRKAVLDVYRTIADAESAVHGEPANQIHFHELGMMDAIADISAAALLVHLLQVDHITVSPVCTGWGTVRCAHGLLPVPAPATAKLLEGLNCFAGETEGELCTPTGAALARHFAQAFGHQPPMTVLRSGVGMGKKEFSRLSAVQARLGETEEAILELSCNVDDMSPEAVGFAIEELLRLGAPDAYYTQIGMKKSRPGLILTCLCRAEQRDEMVRALFRHTTTLGIRETLCRRYVLRRETRTVETPYGPVRIKRSEGYGAEREKAEYDDLRRIARDADLTLDEARELIE